MSPKIEEIVGDLQSNVSELRRRDAIWVLGKSFYRLPDEEKNIALQAFMKSASDSDEYVRFWSILLFKEVFFHACETNRKLLIQLLTRLANDRAERVRVSAIEAICRTLREVNDNDLQILINVLLEKTGDTSADAREILTIALKRAYHLAEGKKKKLIQTALNRLAHDQELFVRESASRILNSLNV